MRNDDFLAASLGGRPNRFSAQWSAGKTGETVEDCKLIARRARHSIAADTRQTRRRAGHQRGEAGCGLGWKSSHDIVRKGAPFDELGEVGKFSGAQELLGK